MSEKLSFEHVNRRVQIGFDSWKRFGTLRGFTLDRKTAFVELERPDRHGKRQVTVAAWKLTLAGPEAAEQSKEFDAF